MKNKGIIIVVYQCTIALLLLLSATGLRAQFPAASTNLQGYGLKIFHVESGLYPFVQVYFRTFDQDLQPLINLNERNIGLMVEGRSYAVLKGQYMVESIRNREEAVRTVFVIDCSKTMMGKPFEAALEAAARFIDGKRPQDQIAIIAIRDVQGGYQLVSNFERDPGALARRLADLRADGNLTRLYDGIGAAMQMSGMVSQGGIRSGDADYVISNSIVVFSDGKDEGSALSRENLMTRIANLAIPIPIYSLAYTKVDRTYLKNLEALSKNSFGIYFPIDDSFGNMTRSIEAIQNILQNDYVLTFRSYLPVDGRAHPIKVGLEYPSRSGKITYQSTEFEAIEPPPLQDIIRLQDALNQGLKPLPDGNPYMEQNPYTQSLTGDDVTMERNPYTQALEQQ